MHSITVGGVSFSAAHRIEGHPKCGRLHGHNYEVSVELQSELLNSKGMVQDFSSVKADLKSLADGLDHHYLVSHSNYAAGDPYFKAAEAERPDDVILLLVLEHTTAEELARWFFFRLNEIYGDVVTAATVKEGAHSAATYRPVTE